MSLLRARLRTQKLSISVGLNKDPLAPQLQKLHSSKTLSIKNLMELEGKCPHGHQRNNSYLATAFLAITLLDYPSVSICHSLPTLINHWPIHFLRWPSPFFKKKSHNWDEICSFCFRDWKLGLKSWYIIDLSEKQARSYSDGNNPSLLGKECMRQKCPFILWLLFP